ncbi:hypothetical protein [Butyrivibrio crossotus]|uniref:Uncharacterized protein n=1 Tax=Eshraghiella crossota DSM 2876 TaxID=511680 RepID=D4RW60_9FIRM|nr:hypothetical protein BUTYVIB_00190 [Butyrivibrio crossotus DSM 2876]
MISAYIIPWRQPAFNTGSYHRTSIKAARKYAFYGVLALSGYGVLEKTLKEKATKALTLQRKGKYIHYLC